MYCQDTIAVKEEATHRTAITLRCRSWSCPDCADLRHKQLIAEAIAGSPRIFLTLTSRRIEGSSPNDAARALAHAWRLLRLRIMRKYGWRKLPFIAVFEATKLGWPHLHILARCGFIDQRFISSVMDELTNSPIVHIELLKDPRKAGVYAAKYCGKSTGKFGTCKRYWQSQDYDLRPPPPEHLDHSPGVQWERRIESLYQWSIKQPTHGFMVLWSDDRKAIAVRVSKKGSAAERASAALPTEPQRSRCARPPGQGP